MVTLLWWHGLAVCQNLIQPLFDSVFFRGKKMDKHKGQDKVRKTTYQYYQGQNRFDLGTLIYSHLEI